MSREIRRLHRKQTQFTNFSSSQATELPNLTESTEQNIADPNCKPLRKRRRPSDSPADANYTPSLLNPTEFTEQNTKDPNCKSLRRRRRSSDFPADTNYTPSLSNPTESTEQNISDNSEDVSAAPTLIANSYSPIGTNGIDVIRAEFQEDIYHRQLAESDYSDDTHDWGEDSQHRSHDYWNFLGSYE